MTAPTTTTTTTTPLILALSGPTSSGKTTLAHALRALLPRTLLIHADDFYHADSLIPLSKDGFQDWDCADALDLRRLEGVLRGLKEGGKREGDSGDGGEGEGGGGDGGDLVGGVRQGNWEGGTGEDGIGVTGAGEINNERARDLFDIKILLRATYEDAKARRKRRNGYVTLEGFWIDPEGYFDMVVWMGYEREYEGLVEGGGGRGLGRCGCRMGGRGWGRG
ncbi:ribosylnicotinamide kinase [Imshaugia aleurites]|uniref:Ribosylnicotinamide kinase n=1 Tax=Imshaugia aleurites TaxID=172621 RepID=A0A8H3ETK1_9LECA|nr:ribosylnicotinamide kinase [Imshaugia aleurites]